MTDKAIVWLLLCLTTQCTPRQAQQKPVKAPPAEAVNSGPDQPGTVVLGVPSGSAEWDTKMVAVLDGSRVLLGQQYKVAPYSAAYYQIVNVKRGRIQARFPYAARWAESSRDGATTMFFGCVVGDTAPPTRDCLWRSADNAIELLPAPGDNSRWNPSSNAATEGQRLDPDGRLVPDWRSDRETPYGYDLRWDQVNHAFRVFDPKQLEIARFERPQFAAAALSNRGEWLAILGDDEVEIYDLPARQRSGTISLRGADYGDRRDIGLTVRGDYVRLATRDQAHFFRRDGQKVCSVYDQEVPQGYALASRTRDASWSLDGTRYSRAIPLDGKDKKQVQSQWLSTWFIGECRRGYSRILEDGGAPQWSSDHEWVAYAHGQGNRKYLRIESTVTKEAAETELAPSGYRFSQGEGLELAAGYAAQAARRRIVLPGFEPQRTGNTPLRPCGGELKKRVAGKGLTQYDEKRRGDVVIVNGRQEIVLTGDTEVDAERLYPSPNGKVLFYEGNVWSCATGKRVAAWEMAFGFDVHFTANGRFAAFPACEMYKPRPHGDERSPACGYVIWDTEVQDSRAAGYLLRTEEPERMATQNTAEAVLDGLLFLEGHGIYDPSNRQLLWKNDEQLDSVSPDRQLLATGGFPSAEEVRIHAAESGRLLVALPGSVIAWIGSTHLLTVDEPGRLHLFAQHDWSKLATVGPGNYLGRIDQDRIVLFSQVERLGLLRVADGKVLYQLHRLDGAPLTYSEEEGLFGDDETLNHFGAERRPGDLRFAPLRVLGQSHPRRAQTDLTTGFLPPH